MVLIQRLLSSIKKKINEYLFLLSDSGFFFCLCINPTSLTWAGCDTKSMFNESTEGFNPEFSFSKNGCLTKAEKPSLLYYLPIAGVRKDGFMTFSRRLVRWSEMQTSSSRIWTQFPNISYNNNWKPKYASFLFYQFHMLLNSLIFFFFIHST